MTGLSPRINCKRIILASDISIIFYYRLIVRCSLPLCLPYFWVYHLETVSAEVSPDISALGPMCPDHFGISTEVSLDTGTEMV